MSELDLDLALWQARFTEHLLLRSYAERTVAGYVAELRPFFEFLEAHGVTTVAQVTPGLVEDYRAHLFYAEYRTRRLTLAAQANRLHAVKRFLRFLCQERYVLVNAGASVEAVRLPPRRLPARLLSEGDMACLLARPAITTTLGLRDRAILEVFYSTAVRNTELCSLTLDAVFLSRGELHVQYGKGNKSRVVPLGEEAQVWLSAYLERSRPHLVVRSGENRVFLSCRGEAFVRQSMAVLVSALANEAGVGVVKPHDIRHACATHMLKRGAGLRHLQELLGHASPNTTQRYTRVDITDLQAIHRRYHPREQGRATPPPEEAP